MSKVKPAGKIETKRLMRELDKWMAAIHGTNKRILATALVEYLDECGFTIRAKEKLQ